MDNTEKTTKDATIALKKAQTSIKNILGMIEDKEYCINIIQQIMAVNGLLKSATDKILENHLNTCFSEGIAAKNPERKKKLIKEVIEVVSLNNKRR